MTGRLSEATGRRSGTGERRYEPEDDMRIRAGLASVAIVVAISGCGGSPATSSPGGPTGGSLPGSTESSTLPPEVTPEASLPPEVTPEPTVEVSPAPTYTIYVVKKGDNPYAIAKHFGITLQALYDANPGLKGHERELHVGQKLNIPST